MKWLLNWINNWLKKETQDNLYQKGRTDAVSILNRYPEPLAVQRLVRLMDVSDYYYTQGLADELNAYKLRQKGYPDDQT